MVTPLVRHGPPRVSGSEYQRIKSSFRVYRVITRGVNTICIEFTHIDTQGSDMVTPLGQDQFQINKLIYTVVDLNIELYTSVIVKYCRTRCPRLMLKYDKFSFFDHFHTFNYVLLSSFSHTHSTFLTLFPYQSGITRLHLEESGITRLTQKFSVNVFSTRCTEVWSSCMQVVRH